MLRGFIIGIACAMAASLADARPLVIYSPHGPELLKAAREELLKTRPDAQVEWKFAGTEELFDLLKKERKFPKADVIWGGPEFSFILAKKRGLLAPFKPSWASEERAYYGDLETPLTFVWNDKTLPPSQQPADWDDLLEPAYTGKITARFPLDSGTMRALYCALIERQLRQGKDLAGALAWMRRLEGQIARYEPHSQAMFAVLGKGVVPLGLWNLPETMMRAREGYPVAVASPRSGMPVLIDGIALVKKDKPNPLAVAFYEAVTTEAFAEKLAAAPFHRIPVRLAGAHKPKFKAMPVDWDRIAEEGAGWLESWQRDVHDPKKFAVP